MMNSELRRRWTATTSTRSTKAMRLIVIGHLRRCQAQFRGGGHAATWLGLSELPASTERREPARSMDRRMKSGP